MASRVDLPAPEGPMTVTKSPRSMVRSMRRSRKSCPLPCLTAFSRLRNRIMIHSVRNATTGSTRVARRAGSQLATRATAASSADMAA